LGRKNDGGLNEVPNFATHSTTTDDLRIGGILGSINITGNLIKCPFINDRVNEVAKLPNIAHFDCFDFGKQAFTNLFP
jgi:hypothetical protein